ncbi:hypothetical protein HK405_006727, partial [Cladochytrium tenue]
MTSTSAPTPQLLRPTSTAEASYKSAETALRQEANLKSLGALADEARAYPAEMSIPDFILFYNETELNDPSAYRHSYGRLRKWVEDSLEKYRMELSSVLFPIFAHTYIDLVNRGMTEQARQFMDLYKAEHAENHSSEVMRLSSVTTAELGRENDLVQSFLSNRYCVSM